MVAIVVLNKGLVRLRKYRHQLSKNKINLLRNPLNSTINIDSICLL